ILCLFPYTTRFRSSSREGREAFLLDRLPAGGRREKAGGRKAGGRKAMSREIAVTLPDGSVRRYPAGITPGDVAKDLGGRIAREAIVAKVNGRLFDLFRPLEEDASLELLTADTPEGLEVLRHSTAHVMAQAVLRLIPEAKLAIGPAIENGFYYDFELPEPLTPEKLAAIEEEIDRKSTRLNSSHV